MALVWRACYSFGLYSALPLCPPERKLACCQSPTLAAERATLVRAVPTRCHTGLVIVGRAGVWDRWLEGRWTLGLLKQQNPGGVLEWTSSACICLSELAPWLGSGENRQGLRGAQSVSRRCLLASSKLVPRVLFTSLHHVPLTEFAKKTPFP